MAVRPTPQTHGQTSKETWSREVHLSACEAFLARQIEVAFGPLFDEPTDFSQSCRAPLAILAMVSGNRTPERLYAKSVQYPLPVLHGIIPSHSRSGVPFFHLYFLYKVRATFSFTNITKSIYCVNLPLLVLQASMSLFPSHCETEIKKQMEHYITAYDLGMILELAVPEVSRYCTADLADKCKALYRAVYRLNDYTMLTISGEDEELEFFSPFSHDWQEYEKELRSQIEESD